jgi:hypothetical protein
MATPVTSSSHATETPSSAQAPAPTAASIDDVAVESQGTDTDIEIVDVKRRKLKFVVWKEFTRIQINGVLRAECMWCKDRLGVETKNGTTHLHDHLKIC